jgi:MoxR-like ATPase
MKALMNEKEFKQFQDFAKTKNVNHEVVRSFVESEMCWNDGPVLKAMRLGCVICLDEIDQAKTGIMSLQTIAQGKPYYNKKTNEIIEPAPGFCLIATANTKGDGDGMDKFAGAQIMNQAFLERFSIIVEQDYPTVAVEKKILSKHTSDKNFIKLLTAIAKQTRKALARQVGIDTSHFLTGIEIENMDETALKEAVKDTTLFSKLTPLQKTQIISLLQEQGNTVGFLGDGINDAGALRQSDIGISVDSAVDIAKESADIILLEKDLMKLIQLKIKKIYLWS